MKNQLWAEMGKVCSEIFSLFRLLLSVSLRLPRRSYTSRPRSVDKMTGRTTSREVEDAGSPVPSEIRAGWILCLETS